MDDRAADPALLLGGVSVVLACRDEEALVADAVRAAATAAARCAFDYEIVVVDDGSTDGTPARVRDLAVADPGRLRLLIHPGPWGQGAALRTGIAAARCEWVLLADADLQFDFAQLEDLLPWAREADLVVGWRAGRRDPLARRVAGSVWNTAVRRRFNLPVRDVECGFKLGRRDLLTGLGLASDGAMLQPELLVKALSGGARVTELALRHRPRVAGRAKGAGPAAVARGLAGLVRSRGLGRLDDPVVRRV